MGGQTVCRDSETEMIPRDAPKGPGDERQKARHRGQAAEPRTAPFEGGGQGRGPALCLRPAELLTR